MINSFNEEIVQRYKTDDKDANCRFITFQVTEDCCLNCSYCYQIHKSHKMMSKETAKQGIDLLFQMYDENKEDAYINHHTKGVVIEFIGGEPFMNIEVMDYITSYFLEQCIQKDHQWLTNSKFSVASNGMLYFDSKVQEYLKKYQQLISLTITIDGPKELHDACRKTHNNEGSFDQAYKAWIDYNKYTNIFSTKITIAPENLDYVDTIFNFFLEHGCRVIYGNPIFEHKWTIEEAQKYYNKLIILADTLLQANVIIENNIFSENIGNPMPSTENQNWCGGTGAMLSFDPDGNAFPCLRYMASSLGESREPIIIGNTTGLYNTEKTQEIKQKLDSITRRSQSTDECFNCHIASGCAWCSAWNYQETGDINKRSTNICWMHRARVLANTYYWNKYYQQNNINKSFILYLDRNIATNIIDNSEYDKLLQLSMRR